MNRSELTEVLMQKRPDMAPKDVEMAVKCILGCLSEALVIGQRIEIRGFGAFSLNLQDPRRGRNPKTGEPVEIKEKMRVHFKPGKEMRDRVNKMRVLHKMKIQK